MMAHSLFVVTIVIIINLVSSAKLNHQDAKKTLEAADVSVFMPCDEDGHPVCISLEGIRKDTINGLVKLRNASGCPAVLVIGGTEKGHDNNGKYTHENGYMVKLLDDDCITKYIESHVTCKRFRGRGRTFIACEDSSFNNYHLDENGWDITYFPREEFSFLATLATKFPGYNITKVT